MIPLVQEKAKAIELRRKGYSYREIRRAVSVSKSSLSLWLSDLPLTKTEKRYLRRRNSANITRGRIKWAAAMHQIRLEKQQALFKVSEKEFQEKSLDPFFHVGIALYWAEGAKRSSCFQFVNSDDGMIRVMLLWIEKFLSISRQHINVRLYIHKPYAHENCEKWWSEQISIPPANFKRTIYKPTGLLIKKRPNYKGCIRVELGGKLGGMTLLRKMQFWQNLLLEYYTKADSVNGAPL
jgi:hypothetical protein